MRKMKDFELVTAEAHRLRREAEARLDMETRKTLEDAAERLEKLAQRLARETTALPGWMPEYRSL
jgi:hypothetical protein